MLFRKRRTLGPIGDRRRRIAVTCDLGVPCRLLGVESSPRLPVIPQTDHRRRFAGVPVLAHVRVSGEHFQEDAGLWFGVRGLVFTEIHAQLGGQIRPPFGLLPDLHIRRGIHGYVPGFEAILTAGLKYHPAPEVVLGPRDVERGPAVDPEVIEEVMRPEESDGLSTVVDPRAPTEIQRLVAKMCALVEDEHLPGILPEPVSKRQAAVIVGIQQRERFGVGLETRGEQTTQSQRHRFVLREIPAKYAQISAEAEVQELIAVPPDHPAGPNLRLALIGQQRRKGAVPVGEQRPANVGEFLRRSTSLRGVAAVDAPGKGGRRDSYRLFDNRKPDPGGYILAGDGSITDEGRQDHRGNRIVSRCEMNRNLPPAVDHVHAHQRIRCRTQDYPVLASAILKRPGRGQEDRSVAPAQRVGGKTVCRRERQAVGAGQFENKLAGYGRQVQSHDRAVLNKRSSQFHRLSAAEFQGCHRGIGFRVDCGHAFLAHDAAPRSKTHSSHADAALLTIEPQGGEKRGQNYFISFTSKTL